MKHDSYIIADNIISPLGFTSSENFEELKKMNTGVRKHNAGFLSPEAVCAAVVDDNKLETEFSRIASKASYTRLEKMFILSITDVLKQNPSIEIKSNKTLIIFSSTKGNIDLLAPENKGKFEKKRLYLWETAKVVSEHFENPNKPLVVSNACISGVLAIILAKRLLEGNEYDTVIVAGGDIMTNFVVSGFQSFKAVSSEVCKPYDASRDGISLGEACGTVVLSNNKFSVHKPGIIVKGGSSSNDANHISGPSRTGDGLVLAIEKTLKEAGMNASEIDYISGHGTATLYNDEMEAQAINEAHLQDVPMNSLKSYFGHTLGAAGIVESIIGIHSMRNDLLIGTYNYKEPGVTRPLNIIKETTESRVNNCLKTAAGFGGCNAAVLFTKE